MTEYAVKLDLDNMTLVSRSSQTNDDWDTTGGVYGVVKIYYNKVGSYYKITQCTGSWTNYDASHGTAMRNRKVVVACNEGFSTDQYILKSISSGSFSFMTNFTDYAYANAGLVAIGANSICELYRVQAGTSWDLVVSCMIAGSFPSP